MVTCHQQTQFAMIVRHAQTFAQPIKQLDAAFFMAGVAWPMGTRGLAFAQIVRQRGESHLRRWIQKRGLFEHQHGVNTGVDFGMPFRRLRHAEKRVDFRKHHCEGAGLTQHFEIALRSSLAERAHRFLPDTLRDQRIQFAACGHCAQQLQRFRCDLEAQMCKARREARQAQHAQRIFSERRRDMTQDARVKITSAVEWIDELAGLLIACNGIDGEVAALQILFEGHIRREAGFETVVARAGLTLGARERVLFLALRMQEYGEILAHWTKALIEQLLRRAAHDHPVAFHDRNSQQFIADSAADEIGLHRKSVTEAVARGCRALLTIALCAALSGCYVLQAARGQMAIMRARQPIERIAQNPATPEKTRARLTYVMQAREFASRELGLPDNKSYRSYADLHRPFVVWNVFAAPEFSVKPHRWCFPIVGCVNYRGYFSERAAQRYARRLRSRNLDATVGGVAAYSTLGHFADPVLNTMLGWSDAELAGTVFHELAHQLIYIPGDSAFNEAFATAVEDAGVARWLGQERQTELRAWITAHEREQDFITLLLATRERVKALYHEPISIEVMRARKQQEFGRLKYEYAQLKAQRWNGFAGYDHWFDRALNNADLVPIATYYACVPGFRRLLDEQHGDFRGFYAVVEQLAKRPKPERDAQLCTASAAS